MLRTLPSCSDPSEPQADGDGLALVSEVDTEARTDKTLCLVVRAQQGDREAFSDLYRQHFDSIYRLLRVRLGNATQAEDVAQEVFIRVYRSLPRSSIQNEASFRSWLYAIAIRRALTALAEKHARPVEPRGLEETMRAPAAPRISAQTLMATVAKLPPRSQQVFMLRYVSGFSIAETGAAIGASDDAVKSLTKRAVARLREDLHMWAAPTLCLEASTRL